MLKQPAFVQAKHFYRGGNVPSLIVIHDMEYLERSDGAEWCAAFFAGANAPMASAHYCVDSDSIVQCVKEEDGAWHTPGSLPTKGGREINRSSIGIEHAGFAKQTATEWDDSYSRSMLQLSAELTASLCVKYNIPAVRLTPEDLKTGERGICGHVDCTKATGVGSHWDPGPNFPWVEYIARVRAIIALLNNSPIAELPGEWPIVECAGVRWSVAPSYIAPIGIGQAEDMARELGCELPTAALVDAIWKAADLKIEPITCSVDNGRLTDWGASMSSFKTYDAQATRIENAIAGRSFKLLAGTHKDVIHEGGKLAIYGWHTLAGKVLQPIYGGHARGWIDYSQGCRLVRRAP